uniref:Uncharacterized protein n=1 Tax=Meloidogyne javanica TaxID=6303 RepID=A0A915MN50_MELJA
GQLPNTLMNEAASEIRQAMNKIEPSSSAFSTAAQLSIRDCSRSRSPAQRPYRPPHRETTHRNGSRNDWRSDGRHARR